MTTPEAPRPASNTNRTYGAWFLLECAHYGQMGGSSPQPATRVRSAYCNICETTRACVKKAD